MTEQDLRAKYKKDTGVYADIEIVENLTIDEDLTIYELSEPIEFNIQIAFDKILYLVWLEEQLIKQLNINQLNK